MFSTEKHHKNTLQQMEHKFFEEKVFVTSHIVVQTVLQTVN